MSNEWFNLNADLLNDISIQMMPESYFRRLIMVFCLYCKNGDKGLRDAEIAFGLRISEQEWLSTKKVFIEKGLIDLSNNVTCKWYKRGYDRPSAYRWSELRTRIFLRDDFTCQYCGLRGVKLECDHVVPVSRGGLHDEDNLVTACFKCNRSKRDKLLSEWAHSDYRSTH